MTTKEEVKALWKRCFNDSDEFVDLYFEKRYKDEINLAVRQEGRIVSALQTLSYPMTFCGEIIPASYISGACTHPDYRRQGWMHRLLADAHRKMYEEDVWVSMLIPANEALFGYYAKSGYAPVFGYARLKMPAKELGLSPLYTFLDETDNRTCLCEHYRYFSHSLRKRSCCVLHPKDDFRVIMADLRLSEGRLLVARRGGLVNGMAFCVMEEDHLIVKELLADNEIVRDSLMKKACECFGTDEVECLVPTFMDSLYLGMARIIHAEKMMNLVARKYPLVEIYIQITGDETNPENNGYYIIREGKCTREHCPDKSYQVCSIDVFTRLLLQVEHPYMSLMLN